MKKILLVDDAEFARMVLRRILEGKGYEICGEASSGKEGVKKYKELHPDLVFCDMRMNDVGGMDCLSGILMYDPKAVVVFCTAIGQQSYITEAYKAGAKGFVEKPVSAENLIAVTEELIGMPDGRKAYRRIMEKRAAAMGIGAKPVLDFFEAFLSINGFSIDDPRVDREFLNSRCEDILVGTRALLSAKMSMEQREQLENIFRRLCDEK